MTVSKESSCSSGPAIAAYNKAQSATLVAMGPMTPLLPVELLPRAGMRPQVGLMPTMPHIAEGSLIDPPPSEPMPNGTRPEATAAAVPEELPAAGMVSQIYFW